MNFLDVITNRYSCRNYLNTKVEQWKLEKILEAAKIAPTGANIQPQKIIVVQTGHNKFDNCVNTYGAPLVLIVCCDKAKVWTRPFDNKKIIDIDASIVTTHMMLMATDLGLNSVWITYFDPKVVKEKFNIPDNYEVVNILAIGYGDNDTNIIKNHLEGRKDWKDFVVFEKM